MESGVTDSLLVKAFSIMLMATFMRVNGQTIRLMGMVIILMQRVPSMKVIGKMTNRKARE
jgi:hypothetical protein